MDPEQRLQRLERRTRSARWLGILAVAFGAMALALTATTIGAAREVRARAIKLVDASGRMRAQLGPVQNGSYGLVLSDAEGRPRALFELQLDGTPRLSLANPRGQALVDLTVFQDAPRLSLANHDGIEFFSLSLEMDGSSRLEIADQTGRPRAILGASDDGSPGLVLVDRQGRPRAELSVSADSSSLRLEGRDGSVFKAPID